MLNVVPVKDDDNPEVWDDDFEQYGKVKIYED